MKCIQAIKESKYSNIGDIKRISDVDAQEKVASGYWKFIPKSEWKLVTRRPSPVVESKKPISDDANRGQVGETISEKQLNRKKSK